jgi:hypothetical protein
MLDGAQNLEALRKELAKAADAAEKESMLAVLVCADL